VSYENHLILNQNIVLKNAVFWDVGPHEPHGISSQMMEFFIVTAVNTSNLTEYNFFCLGPTVLLAMEKAIENTKLNDSAMHYHFIALKQEWLGYVSHLILYLTPFVGT
jgi:hypothetical protein